MADQVKAPARFQFRLRTLLFAVAFVAVFIASNGFGIVGLHYPRAIENDPLLSPLRVASLQGNSLMLEDGRVLEVTDIGDPLNEMIANSDDKIDLETDGEGDLVFICVKSKSWICGTPWACIVNIPLIPDDVPINRRQMVGYGHWVESKTQTAKPE